MEILMLCCRGDHDASTVSYCPAQRDKAAARRFLKRAMGLHGMPEKIAIDTCDANITAIERI